jgi:hypothetical protein
MKARHHNSGSDYQKEIDNKQRNIVWPGPLVNSRGVDEFFWKGSPSPTMVQRISAWLFGLALIAGALSLLYLAWNAGGSAWVVFGGGAVLFGAMGVRHLMERDF